MWEYRLTRLPTTIYYLFIIPEPKQILNFYMVTVVGVHCFSIYCLFSKYMCLAGYKTDE